MSSTTATRPLYLLRYKYGPNIRAHFALFIPNSPNALAVPNNEPCPGTVIQATGNPMQGYTHEFKRNYDPSSDEDSRAEIETILLGEVEGGLVTDPLETGRGMCRETVAIGVVDAEALKIPTPGPNRNLGEPVNDTTNRRCQEWTMEFVRHLVDKGFLEQGAVDVLQRHRDAPDFGVGMGLRKVGGRE